MYKRRVIKSLIKIICIILILFQYAQGAKKLQFHWLNNGGKIVSYNYDWITIKITTTRMDYSIKCPSKIYYTYNPGTVQKFNGLYIPVDNNTVVSISIQQINFWTPNQGVSINHFMEIQKIGFYQALIQIQKFVEKVTIGLQYQGFGISIDVGGYTRQADYYLLLELSDEDISTANIPSQCSNLERFFILNLLFDIIIILIFS